MDREQRRSQILDVAKGVFAEKGYHDAKIDDIVLRARIARGTFYLYFEDKRAIFEELIDRFLVRLGDAILPIELGVGRKPPVQQLTDNVRRVVALFLGDAAMAKILLSDAVGLDVEFDRKLLAFYDEITTLIQRSLAQGEDAGLVRPGNARIRAFCLIGIVKELLYQVLMRRAGIPTDDLVETVMSLVVDGLLTDTARRSVHSAAVPTA